MSMVPRIWILARRSNQIPETANKIDVRIPHTRGTCNTGRTHHHIPTTLSERDVEMVVAGWSVRSASNCLTSYRLAS